ncbi:hypothetical protein WJX72_005532 [[Myrmecia] bisecta]|uniref:Rieske domain-containing protein n=1 Tax=[Myrmecia] bisecta TaxID=41462 RepID=A0AAW1R6G5_9CHLO
MACMACITTSAALLAGLPQGPSAALARAVAASVESGHVSFAAQLVCSLVDLHLEGRAAKCEALLADDDNADVAAKVDLEAIHQGDKQQVVDIFIAMVRKGYLRQAVGIYTFLLLEGSKLEDCRQDLADVTAALAQRHLLPLLGAAFANLARLEAADDDAQVLLTAVQSGHVGEARAILQSMLELGFSREVESTLERLVVLAANTGAAKGAAQLVVSLARVDRRWVNVVAQAHLELVQQGYTRQVADVDALGAELEQPGAVAAFLLVALRKGHMRAVVDILDTMVLRGFLLPAFDTTAVLVMAGVLAGCAQGVADVVVALAGIRRFWLLSEACATLAHLDMARDMAQVFLICLANGHGQQIRDILQTMVFHARRDEARSICEELFLLGICRGRAYTDQVAALMCNLVSISDSGSADTLDLVARTLATLVYRGSAILAAAVVRAALRRGAWGIGILIVGKLLAGGYVTEQDQQRAQSHSDSSPLHVLLDDLRFVQEHTGIDLLTPLLPVKDAHDQVVAALNPLASREMQRSLEEQVAGLQHELAQAHQEAHAMEDRLHSSLADLTNLEAAVSSFPTEGLQQRRNLHSSLDLPAGLREFWYPAEFSSRLEKDTLVPLELFGQPWVLFRDQQGKAACVRDECAHRACPLSLGSIVDGQIQCPYHGWQYSGLGLPPVPTMARPPQGFTVHTELMLEVPVEHGLLLENLLDLAHAPFTHTSTFAKGWPIPDVVKFKAARLLGGNWEPYPIDMSFEPPCMVLSTIGLAQPGKIERGARAENCKNHLHQMHICLPAGNGKTRLLYRMSLDFLGWTQYVPGIQAFWAHIANQVLGEDLVLVAGQQDRMQRGADVWKHPVSYDKLGVRYRRWRNSIASGDVVEQEQIEAELRPLTAGELFSTENV